MWQNRGFVWNEKIKMIIIAGRKIEFVINVKNYGAGSYYNIKCRISINWRKQFFFEQQNKNIK